MAKTRKKPQAQGAPASATDDGGSALATAPQSVGATTAAAVDRERIAQRAYELYLKRGAGDGAAMEDWLTAERELEQNSGSRREP